MDNKNRLTLTSYKVLGELPNLFMFNNGDEVNSKEQWFQRRREIMKTAVSLQFGDVLPAPDVFRVEQLNDGKRQKTFKIHAGTADAQCSFIMKLILPEGENCPIIVNGDMCTGSFLKSEFIDTTLSQGVGIAVFDRTELAHDIASEGRGNGALYEIYPACNFGAIMAWAWGFSRIIDALTKINSIHTDLGCIAASGHSRGGKAAILAGILDERFRIVNPNEACLGGGGCYRIHSRGDYPGLESWPSETLSDIWNSSSFWFGQDLGRYIGREDELPFDSHSLKALIAPRVLFVSEATGDMWANPVGSWQTTMAAAEVYKFLGCSENLCWYYRDGTHGHRIEDLKMLLNIIRHVKYGDELSPGFYTTMFDLPELIFRWRAPNK